MPAPPLFAVVMLAAAASGPIDLHVDFARTRGTIRALHGINKGPLTAGGLLDLTVPLAAIAPPSARLHDCHWPNPDVVDIHAVFPDFRANPAMPSSYVFGPTDEYVEATRLTGAEIIYRLGESIEHTSIKRFVHPPEDFEKWTAICLGIIRHYNEGWAEGKRWGIRYWEIWNEPENKPAMWSGTDEDYFRLYRVAANGIKKKYPDLKIGGPAAGYTGEFVDGRFRPGAFLTNFLAFCRRESLPVDFFSWHCYTSDPLELTRRARGIRSVLDEYGFAKTESHLNEWNFLPGNSWKPLSRSSAPEARQRFYEEMSGAPGAAFVAAALMELQDAPVDVCNLFHGETGGFGLFNEYGVPQRNHQALAAVNALIQTRNRVDVSGAVPGFLAATAGVNTNRSAATILISNHNSPHSRLRVVLANIPWQGPTIIETRRIGPHADFGHVTRATNGRDARRIEIQLERPSVALLRLRPVASDSR